MNLHYEHAVHLAKAEADRIVNQRRKDLNKQLLGGLLMSCDETRNSADSAPPKAFTLEDVFQAMPLRWSLERDNRGWFQLRYHEFGEKAAANKIEVLVEIVARDFLPKWQKEAELSKQRARKVDEVSELERQIKRLYE